MYTFVFVLLISLQPLVSISQPFGSSTPRMLESIMLA